AGTRCTNEFHGGCHAVHARADQLGSMELGIYSFGENTADPATGRVGSAEQRLRHLLEEVELADQLGLDVFGMGEHHRADYVVSSPAVVLAAAAARTKRIRLTSAVTVLSSDDPVRVFQDFATLDLLSGGRAEIMVGRGSFTESFPLFGFDLKDYDALFAEKLNLLLALRAETTITWQGKHRAPLAVQSVYPRPLQAPLPIWIGVGGNPPSVLRAAKLGLPIALAIIGGQPAQFASLVQLYRERGIEAGHDPAQLKVSINSHGYLADDAQTAADEAFPYFADTMGRIGKERGWPAFTRTLYDAQRSTRGADFIGSAQQVIDKIMFEHRLFQHQRFLLQVSVATMPHDKVLRAIELLATEVAPVIRRELGA
ncbi:MAG TPA: LLM class flavin-dependent oxidoreductase, partial [Polyangiales bacterium]